MRILTTLQYISLMDPPVSRSDPHCGRFLEHDPPARPERCWRTAVRHRAGRTREAADRHCRARPGSVARHRRDPRQPLHPRGLESGRDPGRTGRPEASPARSRARPDPGRNGLVQAEGSPPPHQRTRLRSPSPGPRRHPRPVRSRGGPDRLQRCGIRARLNANHFGVRGWSAGRPFRVNSAGASASSSRRASACRQARSRRPCRRR